MIDVRSRDSKIVLRLSDVNVPPYALPSPHTPPEGQRFDRPGQFQMVVERYRDAKSYAETYAHSRFKPVCQNMTAQPASWRPELRSDPDDSPAQATEGSVSFSCSSPDGPRVVVVYARTALYRGAYDAKFWTVSPVISALVTADNVANVQTIAQHMLSSIEKNPQWVLYQKQMEQAGIRDIQRNFQVFMQQMQQFHNQRTQAWNQQVSHFEAQQHASFAQSSSWCDTLTGLTNAHDPYTGQDLQVWTGSKANYYINGLGNVVNATTSPGPAYHQVDAVNKDLEKP
jgi:hypothetical protein